MVSLFVRSAKLCKIKLNLHVCNFKLERIGSTRLTS